MIGGVILDIEGTTTPVSFVYKVLFPYARSRVRGYLRDHAAELGDCIALLRDEWRSDIAAGEPVADLVTRGKSGDNDPSTWATYLMWLMYRDRKSPTLKVIQGRIWEGGYRSGALNGQVYDDVRPALERWRAASLAVAIYSSGSVQSQKLLFSHSNAGDLTRLICCYFDTGVGPKRSADSYREIAARMKRPPWELLFVSDVPAELDAASLVGMRTLLCVRGAKTDDEDDHVVQHERIRTFDEIVL